MPRLRAASCSSSRLSGSLGSVSGVVGASDIRAMLRPAFVARHTKQDRRSPEDRRSGINRDQSGGRAPAARLVRSYLTVLGQKLHDVVEAEPSVTALAYAVERQFAAVAQALYGVDVEVQKARNLACRQHRAQLVDSHRSH